MKRMILTSLIMATVAVGAQAQTTIADSKKNNIDRSDSSKTAKPKKSKKSKKVTLNHRKTYKWQSGQRATPTGQEATGLGSGYSANKKDTAGKREE